MCHGPNMTQAGLSQEKPFDLVEQKLWSDRVLKQPARALAKDKKKMCFIRASARPSLGYQIEYSTQSIWICMHIQVEGQNVHAC